MFYYVSWGDGGGGHWLVRMEWRPAGWSMCLPLLISPCTIKSRSSRKKWHKTVVCVCVCVCVNCVLCNRISCQVFQQTLCIPCRIVCRVWPIMEHSTQNRQVYVPVTVRIFLLLQYTDMHILLGLIVCCIVDLDLMSVPYKWKNQLQCKKLLLI